MNLENIDKEYVLNTYNKNYVNFKRGVNATLFDENNKKYIDFTSGIGVVSVGHGNKQVADAIYKQVSNITHISNLYEIQPQSLLAKEIVELSGYNMACFFGNSGAEANEGAIKIARKYGHKKFNDKKYKVITLENSFHGRTITTVKATGQKDMHNDSFSPYPDGFSFNANIKDVYKSIDDQTVAVMIELVQGEGGVQPLDKQEVQDLAKFLKQKEILLIIDEVQTGAYRTGEFLSSHLYNIEPDIITMAKGVGGGVPIGIVLTKHKNLLVPGDHGSTFGGNYLSTSAALEVCSILKDIKSTGKLDSTIDYFNDKLNEFYTQHKHLFLDIIGIGLMMGLRVKDNDTLVKIISNSFDNGLLVLRAGQNTLRFLPPLTISNEEINIGFERLKNAISNI
jgi:acetylornithine/N-succinyldiaminopimelate aminotransferase